MAIADTNKANENFWLNLASESIYGSSDRRAKSVESLKAIISWAFAIFATGGFALTVFGSVSKYDIFALFSFAAAFFLLTIAYCIANEAQYPVAEDFKPLDPVQILEVFSKTIRAQTLVFKRASGITTVGFFFLALGILIQFGNAKQKDPVRDNSKSAYMLLKTGAEKRGDSVYVPVTIQTAREVAVTLSFIKCTPKTKVVLLSQVLYPDTSGHIYFSYYVHPPDSVRELLVQAGVIKTAPGAILTEEEILTSKLSVGK